MVEEGVLPVLHLCPGGQAKEKGIVSARNLGEVPIPCVLPLLVPGAVVGGKIVQLALVDKPPELPLIVETFKHDVHLAGVHIYLNGDQLIVPGLPEFGVQQGLPVLTPGQVVEQAAGEAILIAVHFDVLGLDQFPDLRLTDIGTARADAAAGHLFPLLHAEEGQHRRAQLRAGSESNRSQTGDGQRCRQGNGENPPDRTMFSLCLIHNTLL